MTKCSKDRAPDIEAFDGFGGRYARLDEFTVGWEDFGVDLDPAPLFVGLPDDRCQCPHWGVVLEGELTFHYGDGSSEIVGAGEAYYARPGHVPSMVAGTSVVEFSPTEELARTMDVVVANITAASEVG